MWSETSEIDKRTRRGASDEWKILYTTITLLNVAQKLIRIELPDAAQITLCASMFTALEHRA